MNENRRFPNLFWPIVLIGIGGLLFLSNLEIIEPIDVSILWRLWPVFLVIVGINMLFGRNNRMVASLFSGVLAVAIVGFLFFSPQIVDRLPTPQMVTESFETPLDGAEAADIDLDFDRGNLTVTSLDGGANLFEAVVNHNEKVNFQTSGTSRPKVRLSLNDVGAPQIGDWFEDQQITADIGLATGIPLELKVDVGSGSADLFLADMELIGLDANSGSGSLEVELPGGDYSVDLGSGSGSITVDTSPDSVLDLRANVGSGRISIRVEDGSYGKLDLESGSGSITVFVPEGMAVQVRGETGSGGVNLPNDFIRTAGRDGVTGDSGTWQTPGFAEADEQLYIEFSVGSGSLRIQYP